MEMGNSSECLPLGAVTWMPHMIAVGELSKPIVTGTMLQVLDIFARHLDFCYKFLMTPDRAAGARLENGTWTGLLGLVVERKAEFTGVGLAVDPIRAKEVDFSEYLYIDEWNVGYQRPKLQSDIAGFVKPFTLQVWLCVVFAMMIVWSAAYVVRIIYARYSATTENSIGTKTIRVNDEEDLDHEKIIRQKLLNVTDSFMYDSGVWTVGSLIAQSVPNIPKGDSVRLLSGLWLLISLILATVYRSNLKAMLILPKVQLPFDNLQELVNSGIPLWLPTDSIFHMASKNSQSNTTMGRLRNQFVSGDKPTDVPWGIRGLMSGEFAFAAPLSGITQIIHSTFSQTGNCASYVMSEGYLKTTIQCLLLPKKSPWKAKLDPLIVRLRESGILDYVYLKGVHNATECLKPITSQSNTKLRPMDLGDFYGVFIIYAGGLFFAFVSFTGELTIQRTKESANPYPVS